MTQPTPPWPPLIGDIDIARQSTLLDALTELRSAIAELSLKVDQVMTVDASVLAVARAVEADVSGLAVALASIQTSVAKLQAEVAAGGTAAITQPTLDALSKAKTDLDAVLATAAANAAADVPPSAAP